MKYIGMDYGSKTLGISVSDKTGIIATSLVTLRYQNMEELLSQVNTIIQEEQPSKIVLGDPLNMDGSISDRSRETYEFKKLLEEKFKLEVILEDERLTTTISNNMLISNNTKRKNRKKVVDKIASTIILQSYLDRKGK